MADFDLNNLLYTLGQAGSGFAGLPNTPMGYAAAKMSEVAQQLKGGESNAGILNKMQPQQPQQQGTPVAQAQSGVVQGQSAPQNQGPNPNPDVSSLVPQVSDPTNGLRTVTQTFHPNGDLKSHSVTGMTPADVKTAVGGAASTNSNFLRALQLPQLGSLNS